MSHHLALELNEETVQYAVYICSECSKSEERIYLGTFLSFEDAMLVNEVHEIIFERFVLFFLLLFPSFSFLFLVFPLFLQHR